MGGDLVESLNAKIVQLQSWLKCRHMKTTQEDKEHLTQIEVRISSLESSIFAMDEQLCKEEESLVFMERMSESLQLHNSKMQYIAQRLPVSHLPVIPNQFKLPSNALSAIIQHTQSQYSTSPQLQVANKRNSKTKIKRKSAMDRDDNPRATKRRRMNNNEKNQKQKKEIAQIETVGKDEFESVPKYVKGRLTQKRLNDAINEFNSCILSKYRVLSMKPSTMSKHQFDFYEKFVKEETAETKNTQWLNGDDLKNHTKNFTFDQTGKAIFNVMRHLKRIKMITGKKPKYVVL